MTGQPKLDINVKKLYFKNIIQGCERTQFLLSIIQEVSKALPFYN